MQNVGPGGGEGLPGTGNAGSSPIVPCGLPSTSRLTLWAVCDRHRLVIVVTPTVGYVSRREVESLLRHIPPVRRIK